MSQRRLAILLAASLVLAAAGVKAEQPSGNTNSTDHTPWKRCLYDARVRGYTLGRPASQYAPCSEVRPGGGPLPGSSANLPT
jgi:hypothetical protein